MRLLLLDQYSDPGGAQQSLLELLPSLRDRGWTALVGIPGDGEMFQRVGALGFETARIQCGPYRSSHKSLADTARFALGTPALAAHIRRLARQAGAELVYVNGPRLLPAAALAALPVPLVFHSHSYLFPGAVRRLAGLALLRARAWLINSCRFVAGPWQPYVPAGRQVVIYNGVASPLDSPRPAARKLTVACIGRIAPEKGQREFVAAAALIRQAIPTCRFVIHGAALFAEPAVERYHHQVRSAATRENVEVAGWTSDIHSALAETDLLLVPSAGHEATTRVILEAHAAGVPVVAFRSGGIPEVIEHGRDGWLAGSTEEMAARAIEFLGMSAGLRAVISRQARDSWTRKFTLELYHQQLIEALERAKSNQHGRLELL